MPPLLGAMHQISGTVGIQQDAGGDTGPGALFQIALDQSQGQVVAVARSDGILEAR